MGGEAVTALRLTLRELQEALDTAVGEHAAHRREHGCRTGTCEAGMVLAARVAQAQADLGMTRFLNEGD